MMTQIEHPFALFAGTEYHANGGIYDFRSSHPTLTEARKSGVASQYAWYHVVDIRTMKVVAES
jgi:hypothetical protein